MKERTVRGAAGKSTREQELKQEGQAWLAAGEQVACGRRPELQWRSQELKQRILEVSGGTPDDWADWKWQMSHRVKDVATLEQVLPLTVGQKRGIGRVQEVYRWAISPYYLSLAGGRDGASPIRRQSVPDVRELNGGGCLDPMNEAGTSPAPCVTRRYPDRVIINVTNQCAMFCRHCQRRRNIGEHDRHASRRRIAAALEYVAANREIRDVLVTGGDALLLSDRMLDWILGTLHEMPHVQITRVGTRVPVTLPQRVTPELCDVLRRYPPIYINTQFNHPLEVTEEAAQACERLAAAGVVLGNQAVLLKGVNDCPHVMRALNHELLRIRVRPYYLFHAKDVRGTQHFRTTVARGLDIVESLRGHTSGLAVPTFVVNAPGGLGKVPLMPQHLVEMGKGRVILRTWENRLVEYRDGTGVMLPEGEAPVSRAGRRSPGRRSGETPGAAHTRRRMRAAPGLRREGREG